MHEYKNPSEFYVEPENLDKQKKNKLTRYFRQQKREFQ